MGWVVVLMPSALLRFGFPFFLILLATASIVLALFAGIPTTAIHQVMYASIDKYALLAVPFFIFAGDLMVSGVSQRLVRWMTSMIGGMRGSLPFTALGTATVFSAIRLDRGDRRRGRRAHLPPPGGGRLQRAVLAGPLSPPARSTT